MSQAKLEEAELTKNYDYTLPEAFIATYPLQPRDSAKLLVYDRKTDTITHSTFKHLLDFIPKNCDVFLNDTRVIKARIFGRKELTQRQNIQNPQGGGKVELLFNKALSAFEFLVMIRGKVQVGMKLLFDENLVAKVLRFNEDGSRVVSFEQNLRYYRSLALASLYA